VTCFKVSYLFTLDAKFQKGMSLKRAPHILSTACNSHYGHYCKNRICKTSQNITYDMSLGLVFMNMKSEFQYSSASML